MSCSYDPWATAHYQALSLSEPVCRSGGWVCVHACASPCVRIPTRTSRGRAHVHMLHLDEWQVHMPTAHAHACLPLTRNPPLSPPPVRKAKKVGGLNPRVMPWCLFHPTGTYFGASQHSVFCPILFNTYTKCSWNKLTWAQVATIRR